MEVFDNVKDMVYCEIDEISRRDKLDMNTVKILGELVDILKDIGSIEMFEDGVQIQEDDYSYMNNYSRNNGMGGGYSQKRFPIYYEGNSYRGGYGRMSNGYSRRRNGGYSREDGKQHIINKLEHLMNEANDEQDRQAIQSLIEQMN